MHVPYIYICILNRIYPAEYDLSHRLSTFLTRNKAVENVLFAIMCDHFIFSQCPALSCIFQQDTF